MEFREVVRQKSVVIVDEQHVFASDELQPEVAALCGAAAGWAPDEGVLWAEQFRCNRVRCGVRMIGDEDDFVVGEGVGEDGMEAAFEDVGAVVRCDDDAKEGDRHGVRLQIWEDLLGEMRGGALGRGCRHKSVWPSGIRFIENLLAFWGGGHVADVVWGGDGV